MDEGADLDENASDALERTLSIIRKRTMGILMRSVSKLGVIVCIDELLKNDGQAIEKLFTPEELCEILMVYNKYNNRNTDDFLNMPELAPAEIKTDLKAANVIRLLFNHSNIKRFAECYVKKLTGPAKEFYNNFLQLIDIIEKKINTSSTQRRKYEKKLGRVWKSNELQNLQVQEYRNVLDAMDNELQLRIQEGYQTINDCRLSIYDMEQEISRDHNGIINQAEKIMARTYMVSEDKTVVLKDTAGAVTEQFHKLVEEHLEKEQKLRKKRFKVETILVNWLSKYDQEMHELQKDYEEIEDNFNLEKEMMDELQEKYDAQEETYIKCMEEKAIEEQRIFDEKFIGILRVFAVRKIQAWWRYILMRRARKGKKGKRGKKK